MTHGHGLLLDCETRLSPATCCWCRDNWRRRSSGHFLRALSLSLCSHALSQVANDHQKCENNNTSSENLEREWDSVYDNDKTVQATAKWAITRAWLSLFVSLLLFAIELCVIYTSSLLGWGLWTHHIEALCTRRCSFQFELQKRHSSHTFVHRLLNRNEVVDARNSRDDSMASTHRRRRFFHFNYFSLSPPSKRAPFQYQISLKLKLFVCAFFT